MGCPTRGHSQTRCLHESGGDREGRKVISSTAAGLPDLQPVEHCTDPALFNVAMEPLWFAIILERKPGIKMQSDDHLSGTIALDVLTTTYSNLSCRKPHAGLLSRCHLCQQSLSVF